jgi:peptide chain release factor 2
MDNSNPDINALKLDVDRAIESLKIQDLEQEKAELEKKQNQPDFWNDNDSAQKAMQRLSSISQTITVWRKLQSEIADTIELSNLNESSLEDELSSQRDKLFSDYSNLKQQLLYSGPFDSHSAILAIYSGAGGTDAQDWAQMLMRMYIRWAEQSGYKATLIQQSLGEEAGIKSATLEISGELAYGKLKSEHGVHRLVRLSPFNADNLRQTSFAKIDVLPEIDTPDDVGIDEKELKIDVYRAGGHGGQSVNTTDSAVRITHLPTGITVSIQNERSQLQNKETALTILRSRLAQLQIEQHAKSLQEIKGPNEQAAWGNQIRNYVLHPYSMVKDTRTKTETTDVQAVLDGKIDDFIKAYLEQPTK